jgi:hypothetical protein
MSDRASVFDTEADFDLSGFAPKQPKAPEKKIPADAVRAVSEAANFPSREALAPPPAMAPAVAKAEEKRELRRYRTGRNVQLNIKVKSETLETFYKIADQHGWVLGETLERAVKALEATLDSKNERFGQPEGANRQ